jgi:spoIIIJ-associated protein
MQSIEKTGETVEAAIAAGLEELGVTAADVMVEVLDEPSRGIMGIGARPARVRLVVMMSRTPTPPPPPPAPPAPARPTAPASPRSSERTERTERSSEKSSDQPRRSSAPRRQHSAPPAASSGDGQSFDYEVEDDIASPQGDEIPDEEADDVARTGRDVLGELLQRMQIGGKIRIHRAESTRDGEDMHWILNISGRQIGRLIGRRGETLAALQYIVRLIISRKLQTRANIIVDAGSYKANRSDRLKQLAHRMADQALSQGRTITLEPMPPHERRIVHLALRTRPEVTTKSIGEGDSRKVTISPVK